MTDHKKHKAAFLSAMDGRGNNHSVQYNSGEDRAVYPQTPDRLRFAENDGDTDDMKLAVKRKNATSDDRMPSISDAYEPLKVRST